MSAPHQQPLHAAAAMRAVARPRAAALRWAVPMLLAVPAVLALVACGATNPYYDPAKPHHRPDGFVNSDGTLAGKPPSMLLRWMVERTRDGLPKPPATFVNGYTGFEPRRPDLALLRDNRTRNTATWIGHATVLVQTAGLNILTDPQFSERAFAVQWAGPKRRVPVPVTLAELPRIDLVLISHSHYDHLDRDSVLALARQPGGSPLFMVPLGLERWMREQGIERVQALDWWDAHPAPAAPGLPADGAAGVEVHCVPAHHWSARTPFDRNRTLWSGWVVRAPGFSFYFAGDTGYSGDFARIGERFGGFDLAAIPVGAYEPRWFMSAQHVDPAEAVRIHRDVRARRSIGIHWGTFELTDEPLDAPIGALADALRAAGVPADRFELYRHGETRVLD